MKLFEKLPKIETHPIGEFRMGAIGYGVTIRKKWDIQKLKQVKSINY